MTQEFKRLNLAGIAAYKDNRLFHIRYLENNRERVRRFQRLQYDAISTPPTDEVGFLASLVLFDLVPIQHLQQALQGLNNDGAFVEWNDSHGHQHRRMLSNFTMARLGATKNSAYGLDVRTLVSWIAKCQVYPACNAEFVEGEVELDCIAWGARNLPMSLWAHLCSIQPMTCLPQASFIRYLGLVHTSDSVQFSNPDEDAGAVLADLLDDLTTEDHDDRKPIDIRKAVNLIDRIIKIFRQRKTSRNKVDDAVFLTELFSIRSLTSTMNPRVTWVICWMIDMFESGTPQKPNAAFETRTRYCRVAAEPLLRGLIAIGERFPNLDAEDLEALCLSVMADPTISDWQGLGAAISSFLLFIHEEFDAPLIRPQLHKYIPDITPRAQYVSAHEVQLAYSWIDQQQGADSRLMKMSNLVLAMGYTAPFRRDELLNLRIGNVQRLTHSDCYEIEISGQLKTQSSVRRVQIEERWAAEALNEWLIRRHSEGANSKDFLFGDPHNPRTVYRRSACNRLLLKVLKLCTADESMTFHALRHSWASRRIEAVFCSASTVCFDRLAHIAYSMGHASAQMTLRFYFHLYEASLKHSIDELQKSMELSAQQASCITGTKPNTLVQRALRSDISLSALVSKILCERNLEAGRQSTSLVPASKVPVLLRSFSPLLTPHHFLKVLDMSQQGTFNQELIAARSGVQVADLEHVRRFTVDLALKLSSSGKRLTPLERQALYIADALHLANIRIEAANNAKYVKLCEFFRLPIESAMADAACHAWETMFCHGHLDASHKVDLAKPLRLFKVAEVDPRHLFLRIEEPGLTKAEIAMILAPAIRTFTEIFGFQPRCETLKYTHPARPQVTLVWSSLPKGEPSTASAAVSSTGLHALMFALSIYANFKKEISHAAA